MTNMPHQQTLKAEKKATITNVVQLPSVDQAVLKAILVNIKFYFQSQVMVTEKAKPHLFNMEQWPGANRSTKIILF